MTNRKWKQLSLSELAERITAIEDPVILTHRAPDADTLGSAIGLYYIFRLLGRDAVYTFCGELPERIAFAAERTKPKEKPDLRSGTLIAVDIAAPTQFGELAEQITEEHPVSLMIDHHALGTPFADGWIAPDAAATGEMIYDLAVFLQRAGAIGDFPLDMVNALYAAISGDTGCFQYANVTPKTHAIAGELLRMGADAAKINRLLFHSKSASILRAEGIVLSDMRSFCEGRINTFSVSRQKIQEYGLTKEDFETAIDLVRQLRGVEISIVCKEVDAGQFRVSLRSVNTDVAQVAAHFGGGGHFRASGCTVSAETSEAATALVVAQAEKALSVSDF